MSDWPRLPPGPRPGPPKPSPRTDLAAELRGRGMSYAAVAREMGVSKGTVTKFLSMARARAGGRLPAPKMAHIDVVARCGRCGLRDIKVAGREPTPHVCIPTSAVDMLRQRDDA